MAATLRTDRDGDVVLLTLDRPERRNALDTTLCHALLEAGQAAVADGARAVVVTGEGSTFCAGADLDGVYGAEFLDALYGMLHGFAALPVPTIAAVNGPAIGGGTQVAVACDLRVAGPTARFAVPTARNAMAVDAWTVRTVAGLAGTGPTRRMLLGGESLDLAGAVACGLVDREGTLEDALAWAQEIATFAPLALAHHKLVLGSSRADDPVIEASFARVWASEDVQESLAARAEKRVPVYRGR